MSDITVQPEFSKLMSLLNNTRVQTQNPALWQFLSQFLNFTKQFQGITTKDVDNLTKDVEGISDATVLTSENETTSFPHSRELLAGTNITFDDTTANERTINATGGSGGGGGTETFITKNNETATLINSWRLIAGTNVTFDTSISGEFEISASSGSGPGDGYWTPITNGDPVSPELLFDSNGDCIVGWMYF